MPNIPLSPTPRFPVAVCWSEHSGSCATPSDLSHRLVVLWQMRAGLPILTNSEGRTLDARALMRAALLEWYGEGFDGKL